MPLPSSFDNTIEDSMVNRISNSLSRTFVHNNDLESDASPIVDGNQKYYIGNYEMTKKPHKQFCHFMLRDIGKEKFNQLSKIINKCSEEIMKAYLKLENYTEMMKTDFVSNDINTKIGISFQQICLNLTNKLNDLNAPLKIKLNQDVITLIQTISEYNPDLHSKEKGHAIAIKCLLFVLKNAYQRHHYETRDTLTNVDITNTSINPRYNGTCNIL